MVPFVLTTGYPKKVFSLSKIRLCQPIYLSRVIKNFALYVAKVRVKGKPFSASLPAPDWGALSELVSRSSSAHAVMIGSPTGAFYTFVETSACPVQCRNLLSTPRMACYRRFEHSFSLGGEMADASDLKSEDRKVMWVRLPPQAPLISRGQTIITINKINCFVNTPVFSICAFVLFCTFAGLSKRGFQKVA